MYVDSELVKYGIMMVPSYKSELVFRLHHIHKEQHTSIPSKATTVSLLASLALRSPTSPVPVLGVEKWIVKAVFDPPAAIPQRARSDALRQSAAMRIPGILKGRDVNNGESVSSVIAMSLRISARKR